MSDGKTYPIADLNGQAGIQRDDESVEPFECLECLDGSVRMDRCEACWEVHCWKCAPCKEWANE